MQNHLGCLHKMKLKSVFYPLSLSAPFVHRCGKSSSTDTMRECESLHSLFDNRITPSSLRQFFYVCEEKKRECFKHFVH
jgi:hypothetical protein